MSNIMYTKAYDSTFWNEVRSSVAYKPFVDELLGKYKVHAAEPILADSFKLFDMFRACGNRNVFQAAYFHKRQRLVVSAMLSMIYPDEPAYLEMLEEEDDGLYIQDIMRGGIRNDDPRIPRNLPK